MGIDDPTQASGFFSVGMNPIMALATKSGKEFVAVQPLAHATSLVMNIVAIFVFATLTAWVEGKIRLLCFAIFLVFTLAFAGCIPQPSAALESMRSFKGSF